MDSRGIGTPPSSYLGGDSDDITVLHVDDDPEFNALVSELLEREIEYLEVETAGDADEGLAVLESIDVDCVVSDHDMPGQNGIEFLETVREGYADLPFVLFTGKGSEEVASDAVSAGVSDYFQKGTGTDQYTLLANRIENAVRQYRAERLSEEHRRLLEARSEAMEASIDGMAILDEDGHYQFVNQAHAEIYGYEGPDALIGNHWRLCYRNDELERFETEVMPTLEAEGSWRGEATGTRTDGSTFRQELSLTVTGAGDIVCVVRDITDRVERQRKLRETTTHLEAVLETTTAAIFVKDLEGRYLVTNEEFDQLFVSDDVDETAGKTDFDLFPTTEAESYRTEDRDVLEAGEPVEFESTVRTDDGDRTYLTLKSPVYDDGEAYGVCGVATDVSAIKARERELERERDRLDAFTSVVSHDLRSPLSVATGRLELAREECDSDHLADVAAALDRMETLLDELLTLARGGETDDLETVDLSAAASESWRTVETPEAATLQVETDVTIRADESRLRQLLGNLVRNAVNHTGSEVVVTVGDLEDGFYVADDGPGIPDGERGQVFDPGFSTDADGTGFGLAIVREIAAAHDWTVSVTESRRGGARIDVTGVDGS